MIGGLFEVVVRAETKIIVRIFGGGIHPTPLITRERPLLVVVSHNVLSQLRADRFEEISKMSNDGEIAENGMLGLQQIVDDDCEQNYS